MVLHQVLKNLCSKSGWCYAVFWKLKRRSRMVLTWEDGFYEYQSLNGSKMSCSDTGGNPLVQGSTRHDTSFSEGQINLAVAKMSYCVYFLGEGIIGRVAFTGKHQWVFGDGDTTTPGTAAGVAMNSRSMPEKYPSGWEAQFAAGIKTIAVIAVPQGVVQLGSTQMIMESLEWVDHVRSTFGTAQSVPGAIVSDVASEGQGGKATRSSPGMSSGNVSTQLNKSNPNLLPTWGIGDSHGIGSQSLANGFDGRPGGFSHSNLQTFSSIIKPAEPLQTLPQKPEQQHTVDLDVRSTSVMLPIVNSSLQNFGPVSTSPEVDFGSSSIHQTSLQCEDLRNYHHGDYRNSQLRNSLVQCSPVDGFNRVPGPEADANVSMSLYEQSNSFVMPAFSRVMDSRSHVSPASISEINLQQSKGASSASTAPFGFNSFTNVKAASPNGIVGNTGQVAAGEQASMSSFGSKSHGDPEFLVDSATGDMSHIMPLNSCSKDPIPLSDGDVFENLVSGGGDDFDTYLASVAQGRNNNWDCSFGIGDELSQALGPAFRQSNNKWEKTSKPLGMGQHTVVVEQHTSGATCALSDVSAIELIPTWSSSFVKSEPYFPECKSEPLLDAVVASASSSYHSMSTAVDDSFSCKLLSAKGTEMSVLKVTKGTTPFKHPRGNSSQDCMSQSIVHAGPVDCEASVNNQALSKVFSDPHSFSMSTSCSPLKAILNSWSEDMQSMRSDSTQTSQSKKPEELNKATRKRARPGESTRPRPKDRQQIQDRVRELREIVPNGSKCSIDALLEKTIKHMLFLQNVTLHADNLKKNGELKDDAENSGASWALEVGGEDTARPPILVKNLNQPRQLLVEMFCEEKGHFLEIADIIRNLGLTILKGVMESRSDKIWARFVVEANRDVRRVDIMMSLMHLLHVNNSSSSSMTIASQNAPLRSQPGVDSSSSSQIQTLCGFQQSSLPT